MKQINKQLLFLFFICFLFSHLRAGDFSLGPRIFTQKGRIIAQEFFLYTKFDRATSTVLSTDIGYGLTKNTGIQVNLPILAAKLDTNLDTKKTIGFGDMLIMGQWHFYKVPHNVGILQFGIKFPTSTTDKEINSRARGAYSFVFDLGYIHSSDYWYAQARTTVIATTEYKNINTGLEGRWSCGGGHRWNRKDLSLYLLLELAGLHLGSVKVNDIVVPNTSGDQIFVIPEIFFEKGDINGGLGVGFPIMQKIGKRPRVKWFFGSVIKKRF